ncbi:hypothetical protein A3D84_05365 [Candidatus Woesebacteria bacterium RIFCSPHIGHO2_02_FULL_42_20]|uniref:Pyridoxamine 5'-phosphate oxidase N-terminal domain-containing protein n=1 Tax=Candidatus Woesebacteria bacterium RIFCSPHIGHO2_12_FULL_41_24 TaxID=1802510 RepID=A0A1F8APU9_9BACT|nr:MAG: hypothetical protein A2W15_04645 [Candidatus Woesebacteria bacterium RBG_16_41_13]OGM30588.1 MAG: hypothetical protein A2873_00540 [Candidatus Woesebacteria bacterium RIFCSPHIGHO2_01_FULL_42_80]OGM34618.1 MAG: hypothetical protein A3D84_05365 [Candidatus Woesebacteria bacterium RIFCSPHIGHO2_02_FULL_42_20]OGM53784.1 MAG: hypothetical protein A3E44_05190 [Candidatus Woesebacteria bacterium RIFCSPHIGHO2_12_FULL_41_24]OGM71191.1 MAG: hypothetical protein A3I55_05215 [Candidatus Woesebacteri
MNKDIKKEFSKYLKSQRLMTLATCADKPWVATVYFAVDNDLNFYFVSSPKSKHCKDIEKNSKVAVNVADSHTPNSAKKVGIQAQGVASQVKGWERTKVLLKMWHRAAPGMEGVVNVKSMKEKIISSRVYKIQPTFIKYFNQKLYGEEGCKTVRL